MKKIFIITLISSSLITQAGILEKFKIPFIPRKNNTIKEIITKNPGIINIKENKIILPSNFLKI